MNTSILEVTPAYGKTYATPEAASAAWSAGADFRGSFGGYVSAGDAAILRDDGVRFINIRQGGDVLAVIDLLE